MIKFIVEAIAIFCMSVILISLLCAMAYTAWTCLMMGPMGWPLAAICVLVILWFLSGEF